MFVLIFIVLQICQGNNHRSGGHHDHHNKRPNILLMVIDDFGWSDLSHGSHHLSEYPTKHMDHLLSTGVELLNYYVHPVCSPSRSALLTGQYSFKNGLQYLGTIPHGSYEHIPFGNPTFPELLKPFGYKTEMLGKWHIGYASWSMTPTGRGFDNHFGYLQGSGDYYTHQTVDKNWTMNGFDFFDNKEPNRSVVGHYSTDLFFERYSSIWREQVGSTDPLFMFMSFQTIHQPIGYPQRPPTLAVECDAIADINRKIYCQKVIYMDTIIGEMIQLLKDLSIWDDTLLIFTSDNGGMPNWIIPGTVTEHEYSFGCNYPYRGGKSTLFEGGIKGVNAINGGRNVLSKELAGTVSNVLSHEVDWIPTVIEGVLKESLPSNIPFDGINIWDKLLNDELDGICATDRVVFVDIEAEGLWSGLRHKNYKFIQDVAGEIAYNGWYPCDQTTIVGATEIRPKFYLFDLDKDPFEKENIAEKKPVLVAKYAAMIEDYVQNGGYMKEQNRVIQQAALPKYHDGIWIPWLGDNIDDISL